MEMNLKQEIFKLSVAERIQLVEDLWESILCTPELVPVTETQKAELDRRRERFTQGSTRTRTWEEVKKELIRE
jgi:putative addiction module component (TIGR02574 family)